jgi:hypothetical protein
MNALEHRYAYRHDCSYVYIHLWACSAYAYAATWVLLCLFISVLGDMLPLMCKLHRNNWLCAELSYQHHHVHSYVYSYVFV